MEEQSHQEGTRCSVRTIRELLLDGIDGITLRIPSYQRKYTWDNANRRQLCQDIITACRSGNSEYHLGTLIFHEHECKNGKCWDIVDGQQRLTTLAMMLNSDEGGEKTVTLKYDKSWLGKETFWKGIALWENPKTRSEILDLIPNCTVVCIVVTDISEAFQLFSTQNGRGKELTPVNLLKAYHFHEMQQTAGNPSTLAPTADVFRIEARWEHQNSMMTERHEKLLTEVLSEHLFRLRKWGLGNFITELFSKQYLGEFKGITLDKQEETLPLMNPALLRRLFRTKYQRFRLTLQGLGHRLGANHQDPEELDPFASATQPIINGEDFFNYASTFVTEYQLLFPTYEQADKKNVNVSGNALPELAAFHDFHAKHCLRYSGSERVGDAYARHVFESLCLLVFDRFGIVGLEFTYMELYRFAYYERYLKSRLFYQTAGSTYAVLCCNAVLSSETMEELGRQFDDLSHMVTDSLKVSENPPQFRPPEDSKCFSDHEDGQQRIQIMTTGRLA